MAPPVITITRQYASGGSEVARLVAAELGWDVIDNEFVDEVARRAGLPPDAVAQREERAPGLLERLAHTLAAGSPEMFIATAGVPRVEPDEAAIVQVTERVIAEAAAQGRIVLVGRVAPAAAPGPRPPRARAGGGGPVRRVRGRDLRAGGDHRRLRLGDVRHRPPPPGARRGRGPDHGDRPRPGPGRPSRTCRFDRRRG